MIARILLGVLFLIAAGPARAEPPVWSVNGKAGNVVMFGSIHLLPPNLNWQPAALKDAIAAADAVYFEIPIDDATREMADALGQRGASISG